MTESRVGRGFGDFHSHLFPGVDDGARHVQDSLESVSRMVESGITRIITTPHFYASLGEDPARWSAAMDLMDRAWDEVQPAVTERFPALDFRRGHEVMLDVPDADLSDPRLHLGGTSFILVEWPRLHIPPGTVEVLRRVVAQGLRPVIAHPERYVGVDPTLEILYRWKEAGALLQGNYGSFVGRYGTKAQSLIRQMLEAGLLDYLSSDFHGRAHLQIYVEEAHAALSDLGGHQQIELLSVLNPSRLFKGDDPLPVPSLVIDRGLLNRFKGWLGGRS